VVTCLKRGAGCHCIPKLHHLLPHLNPDCFTFLVPVYPGVMDVSSYRPMGASVARLIILVSGARSRSWN